MSENNANIKQTQPGCFVYHQDSKFELVSGASLTDLTLAYETYGELNSTKDNVILIHHSLSMSAHVADYHNSGIPGWWENMLGPGLALDTNKYFIICINNIGSCFGSTGPSNYKNFPQVTLHDIARSQKLLLDYLGINKIKLVIGSSIGGMISLAWLQLYPSSMEKLFLSACSVKAYPVNIYNRMIQQEVIKNNTSGDSSLGLKLARMIGYYYYRTDHELNQRFAQDNLNKYLQADNSSYINGLYKQTELYNYFSYNADKFISEFDPESYLCLLNALDLFDLTIEQPYQSKGFVDYSELSNQLDITLVAIKSDMLFPVYQQQDVYNYLKKYNYKVNFIIDESPHGHDAFFTEYEQFSNYITDLISSHKSAVL